MKNNIFKVTVILSLMMLAGCSQDENKNKNSESLKNDNNVPTKLDFQKPAVGPDLTLDQVKLIKKEFTIKSMMILPPGELIFPDKNASQSELARKEQTLARTDRNSYDLLIEMRAGCKKSHPNVSFDATFPLEQNVTQADLLVGDKLNAQMTAGLTGSSCPVDYSGGVAGNAEVVLKDDAEKSISAKASEGGKITAVMKNPKYAQLLGARGMIVDTSISGLGIKKDIVMGQSDRGLITYNLNGTYLSLNADIPYSAKVKALIATETLNKENTSIEVVFDLTLKMTDFNVNLMAQRLMQGQKILSSVYYLNGHEKTEAELKELFGEKATNQMLDSRQALKSLN